MLLNIRIALMSVFLKILASRSLQYYIFSALSLFLKVDLNPFVDIFNPLKALFLSDKLKLSKDYSIIRKNILNRGWHTTWAASIR